MGRFVLPRSQRLLRRAQQTLFWLWVPTGLVLGASLLAPHWTTLPMPAQDDADLVAALERLRTPGDEDAWMAVHVLYAACSCSGRVVDHLARAPRPQDLVDKVLLVGTTPAIEARLSESSMTIVRTTPDELAERFAIEGAPMLLVVDPKGVIRYRGGYTERKQSFAIHDLDIIARLRADDVVATLPLFGCAVSDELRALLDPFRSRTSP
jgi:hypothetical protein